MSLEKTPAQIAEERDERVLYLSDPELYGALVNNTSIWLGVDVGSSSVVAGTFENGRFTPLEDEAIHYTADMTSGPAIRWHKSGSLGMTLTLAELTQRMNLLEPEPALDPETFANLPFEENTLTGSYTVRHDDQRLFDVYMAEPKLTLRTIVERLGYDVTEEIDAILADNPAGPWTQAQLETIFAADIDGNHPHGVEFLIQKDQDGFPGGIDDGDEDTRL